MNLEKYSKYKDSGEQWLGEVPSHWKVEKLKYIFIEKRKVTNPDLNSGSISFGKVVYKSDNNILESTKASYQEVLKGEFLINPLNLNYDLKSLRIALSEINVVVSSGYIVLKSIMEVNKNYYNYLLHRYDVSYMKLLGSGVRQTLNFNNLSLSLLPIPPKEEQIAIANFLDDKCGKIDLAVKQKEELIALLKEKKQIIVQNAVTKGIDPNRKMKDSGVEWIGEIPEEWEVNQIKRFTLEHRQGYYSEKGYDLKGHKVVRITDMLSDNQIDISNSPYYFLDKENINRYQLKKQDFLFQRTGSHKKVGIFNSDELSVYASFLIRFRFNEKVYWEFFKYFFNSLSYQNQLNSQVHGSVNPNINAENIKVCIIAFPSLKEQYKICSFLKNKLSKLDEIIEVQEKQIEKLKEYKETLINSSVTGKIRVK